LESKEQGKSGIQRSANLERKKDYEEGPMLNEMAVPKWGEELIQYRRIIGTTEKRNPGEKK